MSKRRRFGPPEPLEPVLTAEDLNTLDRPNDELHRQLEAAMTPQEKGIRAARILYARLLAGIIPPEEIAATERTLVRLIDTGGWPWYKSDLKCIWLAIRGCGFQPGYPLKEQSRTEIEATPRTSASGTV